MNRPPSAKKIMKEFHEHDNVRIDNYYWMNERENPEVVGYLEAENDYATGVMADTKDLQEKLYGEIIGRMKQTDMSVPYLLNGYYYYTRFEEGKEYPFYCRKEASLENDEHILLDVNEMAHGHRFIDVSGISISPDNKMMAYGVDRQSRRMYTIYFKDIEKGTLLKHTLSDTTGTAYWANDNKTVFYAVKDKKTLRSDRIFRLNITDGSAPILIYTEKDPIFNTYVYKSRSREYIIIGSSASLTDEFRFLPADTPEADFTVFQSRIEGLEYSISHFKDKFLIRTNWNAKNFRLMESSVKHTTRDNWKELIPHREEVLLEGCMNFDKYMVIDERIRGNTCLRIMNTDNREEHYLPFNEEVYTTWISINYEYNTSKLRLGYSSLTTPSSVYDYDMETREMVLLKQQEIVGGYHSSDYKSERIYAKAPDGKEIPLSLVYKKGISHNGSAPLLLYGYGSYGITIDPSFSSSALSLLDRGFIYAIAHIRGGQFLGRDWYEDGKFFSKKNTFTDFIACAEFLISNRYTSANRLMAVGRSAGGLLMGAVVNMQPELFKGVIASVPFVDIVTTMFDDSIPLTTGEYDEWGNPNIKEYYEYMLSYSPYDNVREQSYPNMLIMTGFHDSQVQYWEPAKWVAKLRELKTDDNILLLRTNMDTGHGGASGRFERHRETALEYAFMLKLVGIKE